MFVHSSLTVIQDLLVYLVIVGPKGIQGLELTTDINDSIAIVFWKDWVSGFLQSKLQA